MFIHTGLIGLY